jgi:isopenicillin N synthase-like dioxygenase
MTTVQTAPAPQANATTQFSEEEELRLMDYPDSTEEIPTLDMSPYLKGEPGGRERVAAHLKEISETIGFFYLTGHSIPDDLQKQVFEQSKRFHSLPEEVKNRIPLVDVDTHKTGYQGGGEERSNRANVNIIKDAKTNLYSKFTVIRETDPKVERNVWPENLPGFKEVVVKYHAAVEKLGRQFLPLWATALNLPLDYFDKYFEIPHVNLSLLLYPPQKNIGNRQYGIAPHTDNSMMTFLQANASGNAVRMPSGHWRLVELSQDRLLINTGNLLVRWTNGQFLSTKHRVINTNTFDRYAIPVFWGPSADALIEVLPTCQGPNNPPKNEPITYRELRKWYYGYAD